MSNYCGQKWEIWHNFQYQANGNPKWQKKLFFRKSYNMSLLGISMIMMIHLVIKIFIFLFRWSGSSIFNVWKIKGSEKPLKWWKIIESSKRVCKNVSEVLYTCWAYQTMSLGPKALPKKFCHFWLPFSPPLHRPNFIKWRKIGS